jgi:hypothetical protein
MIRMLMARFFAAFSEKYSEITRFYLSLGSRLLTMLLLALLPFTINNSLYLLTWGFLINIPLVMDSYLTFHLKYYFSDAKHISLVRYSTIGSLGSRGLIALASMIAVLLNKNDWLGLTVTCSIIIFLGVIASCLTILYVQQHANFRVNEPHNSNQAKPDQNARNTALLGSVYLFLMNLFFGAGALLLTRSIVEHDLVIYDSLNIVTFFYTGFIIINLLVTLFDKTCSQFITWKNIIFSYFITAALGGLFFIIKDNPDLCFILATLWGIVYGWSLTAFFPLVAELIRGKNQTTLYAKIDAASRFGFIISQLITGVFLDTSIDPFKLLQIYSFFAVISLILSIIFYRKKIMGVTIYENAVR